VPGAHRTVGAQTHSPQQVHREDIARGHGQIRSLYADLKAYKANPTADAKVELQNRFDTIFTRKTRFTTLNQSLKRIYRKESELLLVLDRPGVALHTPSMTSCTITSTAIEHYADTVAQFEHLLVRLTHEETQRVTRVESEANGASGRGELLRRMIQGTSTSAVQRSRCARAWWGRMGFRGPIGVKAASGAWRPASGR